MLCQKEKLFPGASMTGKALNVAYPTHMLPWHSIISGMFQLMDGLRKIHKKDMYAHTDAHSKCRPPQCHQVCQANTSISLCVGLQMIFEWFQSSPASKPQARQQDSQSPGPASIF